MSDGPLLARASYIRAAEHRRDADWIAAAWERGRVLLLTPKSSTRATRRADGEPALDFATADQVPADAPRRFLGTADGVPYFTATVEQSEGEWLTLRDLGIAVDDLAAGLLTSAVALEQWHQRHPRCPLCGVVTHEAEAGWLRECPADGSHHFPRTDPAVIMLIHDGADRTLLGRGPQWGPGRFSTLAGFVEPGESLEAAVAREVFEETGVGVTDIRYVASQPWPFPASLMVGFSGVLDGDPRITLDPIEMADADWFTRDEVAQAVAWTDAGHPGADGARLRAVSPKLSISRYLVDAWLAGEIR